MPETIEKPAMRIRFARMELPDPRLSEAQEECGSVPHQRGSLHPTGGDGTD